MDPGQHLRYVVLAGTVSGEVGRRGCQEDRRGCGAENGEQGQSGEQRRLPNETTAPGTGEFKATVGDGPRRFQEARRTGLRPLGTTWLPGIEQADRPKLRNDLSCIVGRVNCTNRNSYLN